jgi:hypothetical protein
VTEGANSSLDRVEGLFKDLFWDGVTEAAILAVFASVPWLNVWPLSAIVRLLLKGFSEKMFTGLKLIVDLQAIAFLNEEHKKAYDKASVQLKIIANDKGVDSPEFKRARENAKEALSRFVSFGT